MFNSLSLNIHMHILLMLNTFSYILSWEENFLKYQWKQFCMYQWQLSVAALSPSFVFSNLVTLFYKKNNKNN